MHAMEIDPRSSTEGEDSAAICWLMPSAADLLFAGLFAALVFTPLAVRLLGDAGIGWHIRTGQQIVAAHAVPHTDPFSSSMGGRPWFAWEWLYDIVVAKLEAAAGLNGVVWFTAAVIAATFAWMFRLLLRRGTNLLAALVLVLLACSASTIHFLARPHVLSWLLTLAWFWILDSSEESASPRGKVWLLPLLMLVWVNVHGGFLMGFVLLGIYWLGAAWRWRKEKHGDAGRRWKDLTLAGLACGVASLVNPYGWKLHGHVYAYLTDRFLMQHIDEFQSPNFHDLAQKCFLGLLLIALAVLFVRGRGLRASQGLVALFAVYAALYATRNIPTSAILLGMIAGPLAPDIGFAREFFSRMAQVESGMRGHLWPVFLVAIAGFIAINGGSLSSRRLMDAHFDAKRMPVEAVRYLEERQARGAVLAPDSWGGYLIYRLYPQVRVVVDDRHDFYGSEFLKSYLRTIHAERGWEEFLQQHDPAWVVLPRDGTLANRLAQTAGWRSVYADETAMVFASDGGSR
jgi:hypothetical protein